MLSEFSILNSKFSSMAPDFRYLDSLQASGIRPGLERVRELLEKAGSPERQYRSVLVAGTNGKGSTSSMLASILHASGYRTGLYTSPHLVDIRERWLIDGEPVRDETLSSAVDRLRQADELCDFTPTYFEALTIVAFVIFELEECDVAVLEVGMGGRLDATNVVEPIASVISSIGMDHTEFLGPTLEDIAAEKAGIIHSGSVAVTSNRDPRVIEVLERKADQEGAVLHRTSEETVVERVESRIDGLRFDIRTPVTSYSLDCWLAGDHQIENATLAVRAAELMTSHLPAIIPSSIERGVASARWRGRLELFRSSGKLIVVDGGHNSQAASAIARFVELHLPSPRTLVFGIMRDKDVQQTAEVLFPLFQRIVITRPDLDRALPLDELSGIAARLGYDADGFENPEDAIDHVLSLDPEAVVICGSLYLAGAAVAYFDRSAATRAASRSAVDSAHDIPTSR